MLIIYSAAYASKYLCVYVSMYSRSVLAVPDGRKAILRIVGPRSPLFISFDCVVCRRYNLEVLFVATLVGIGPAESQGVNVDE